MKEDPNYLQSLKDRVTALRSDASRAEQLQEAAVRRIAPAVLILRQTPHLLGSITEWRPYEKSGRSLD